MMHSPVQQCPACGKDLVLEMDPAAPPDEHTAVLLADPPFRYACPSTDCSVQDRS